MVKHPIIQKVKFYFKGIKIKDGKEISGTVTHYVSTRKAAIKNAAHTFSKHYGTNIETVEFIKAELIKNIIAPTKNQTNHGNTSETDNNTR